MATKTSEKLKQEVNSFVGLALINIVFSAIAMALGISIIVPNITSMVTTQSVLFPQIVLVVIGFLASVFSIKWLISSAEMFEVSDELKEDYTKNKTLDEEAQTGLIVKMMSYYRENKSTIKKMMWVSRIAGFCFLISGAFNLITAVINAASGVQLMDVWMQVLGAIINFVVAMAGFIMPHFFGKYNKIWDKRIEKNAKAEVEFRRQFGEE
jgi:hypothetical protein